jgi:hypothetical protein
LLIYEGPLNRFLSQPLPEQVRAANSTIPCIDPESSLELRSVSASQSKFLSNSDSDRKEAVLWRDNGKTIAVAYGSLRHPKNATISGGLEWPGLMKWIPAR